MNTNTTNKQARQEQAPNFDELNTKYKTLMNRASQLIGTDFLKPMTDVEEKQLRSIYHEIDLLAEQITENYGYDRWFAAK